jgi:hypothetical protein
MALDQNIVNYINQYTKAGYNQTAIKQALLDAGHTNEVVNKYFVNNNVVFGEAAAISTLPSDRLLKVSELFERSLGILKDNWKKLLKIELVMLLVGAITFGVFMGLMSLALGVGFSEVFTVSDNFSVGVAVMFIVLILVLGTVFMLVGTTRTYLIYKALSEQAIEQNITVAYKINIKKALTLISINLLLMMIVAGGFLVFWIPGIILSIATSLALYVYIVDGVKGSKAIALSRFYVKGFWWKVFGRFFVISGGFMGLSYLIVLLTGVFEEIYLLIFLLQIINLIISLAFQYLIFSYGILIYKNLKAIKQSQMISEEELNKNAKKQMWWLLPGFLAFGAFIVIFVTALINPSNLLGKTKKLNTRSELTDIKMQLEYYKVDNDKYPQDLSDLLDVYISNDDLIRNDDGDYYKYSQTIGGRDYRLCVEFDDVESCFGMDDVIEFE